MTRLWGMFVSWVGRGRRVVSMLGGGWSVVVRENRVQMYTPGVTGSCPRALGAHAGACQGGMDAWGSGLRMLPEGACDGFEQRSGPYS